ncbi:MAG: hypothetical protein AB8B91_25225 [Rubripirellula sp.]
MNKGKKLDLQERLTKIAQTLVDQTAARTIVAPQRASTGHWFGGGNMVEDRDGTLWLVGRFRNQGDSRTGLGMGERGLELAIFRSSDHGKTFEKAMRFSKADLNVGSREVLSIEGTALRLSDGDVELFISTEKSGIGYPPGLESYLKPGTGVWTVDRLRSGSLEGLRTAPIETLLQADDGQFVHVKDPFLGKQNGQDCLLFCTHPFCWTSSNTGYASLAGTPSMDSAVLDFFPRGFTWDVAITRGTSVLPLPKVGVLAEHERSLFFYDGGECVRNLDEHSAAVQRPRGYSCEELGGVAYCDSANLHALTRLSINAPLFVSPHGTGCSRYVDVLATKDRYYATWQQAQPDGSQPLVMNVVERQQIEDLLTS